MEDGQQPQYIRYRWSRERRRWNVNVIDQNGHAIMQYRRSVWTKPEALAVAKELHAELGLSQPIQHQKTTFCS
jgi:hypothetical protein